MTKPADSDHIAKARLMNPEAIKERIQLAHAAQKELCAEISRSEDGEFGLDLFDVLQAMYNSGYERAASERQAVIEECCRAVCAMCKSGEIARCKYGPPKFDAEHGWIHYLAPDYREWAICVAAAIRSMGE